MPRRGGGGGSGRGGARAGAGGGARPPQSREKTISKAMSFVLRHGAEKEGLKMDENGYANVAELLSWRRLSSLHVTFPEMRTIVTENDKQRFTLIPADDPARPLPPPSLSDDPSKYLIRAAQGHSLPISSANLLTPITVADADFPAKVVHGTSEGVWKLISKSGGLKVMGRQHVHFARGVVPPFPPSTTSKSPNKSEIKDDVVVVDEEDGAESAAPPDNGEEKVISGMRRGATVLIWVDVKRSLEKGGLKWWKSENGVILTEGDEEGRVGMEWVVRVERRGSGEVIWEPEQGGGER